MPALATLPRFLLLWLFTPLIALVSWRFLLGGVEATMPHMAYHAEARQLPFLLHVTLGPLALLLLPFQFWTRLRLTRPGLHRLLGRIYAISILLAGYGGLRMALGTEAGPAAAWGFGLLAVIWVAVTGVAVAQALRRRISLHRTWMIRSAALTLAGTTLRLELPLLALGMEFPTAYSLVAWTCWLPNLMAAEWLIRRPRGQEPGRRSATPVTR